METCIDCKRRREELVLDGEVRWYHVARSRAVRRILERSIARWMELHHLITESEQFGIPGGAGERRSGHASLPRGFTA